MPAGAGDPETGQLAVTTSAQRIVPTSVLQGKRGTPTCVVFGNNHATQEVFIGKSTVTTANGFAVKPSQQLAIDTSQPENYFVIAAAAGSVTYLVTFTS